MSDFSAADVGRRQGAPLRFALVLGALVTALTLVAASLGSAGISVLDVGAALVGPIFGSRVEADPITHVIVWNFRLPRIAMAIVAGLGLAMSGATMQGVLRNPLVSPFTIGVSGGAVLGASVAIVLGADMIGSGKYLIMTNAFLFAMGTSALILGLGRLRGVTPEAFILVGIALMNFFSAFTALLQYIASEEQLSQVVHWTFGSLTGSSWGNVALVVTVLAMCFPLLMRLAWDLNTMAAGGDEVAVSLGVNCGRVRILAMLLSSLMTATVISFTGLVGFVGLVAPHITRQLLGSDHRSLIPLSGLVSAILLLLADTVGRNLFAPTIIPVGIVTAFIGAPFFFYLLMKGRKRG